MQHNYIELLPRSVLVLVLDSLGLGIALICTVLVLVLPCYVFRCLGLGLGHIITVLFPSLWSTFDSYYNDRPLHKYN